MSIHNLKIRRQPFDDLVSGRKTGEVRNCADREFREGDQVELFLIDETGNPANKSIVRTITHIQRGYGLPDDICVLSYAAPVVERQEPAFYRVVTPRTTINGEVTEWWPSVVIYTKEQLSSLVGPYKIEQRLYTSSPAPVVVDERQALQDRHEAWMAGVENGKFPVADLVQNLEAVMAMFAPDEDRTNRTLIAARACLDKVKELNQ